MDNVDEVIVVLDRIIEHARNAQLALRDDPVAAMSDLQHIAKDGLYALNSTAMITVQPRHRGAFQEIYKTLEESGGGLDTVLS